MRKRVKGKKFSRKVGPRKALIRGLVRSLLIHGKIETTETKAKETSRFVERILTKAKKGDLQSRRHILQVLDADTAKKTVDELGPKYKDRPGGYTRIVRLGPRISDGANMAVIELI